MTAQSTWQAPVFIELEEPAPTEVKSPRETAYTAPVLLDEPALARARPEVIPEPERNEAEPTGLNAWLPPALPRQETGWLAVLVFSLFTYFVATSVVDMFHYVAARFETSFFLGAFFLALVVIITTTLGYWIWSMARELLMLRTVADLQRQGLRIRETRCHGEALPYLHRVARLYQGRAEVSARLDNFFLSVDERHGDDELCQLFSQRILRDLDTEAREMVSRHAYQTALLVIVSPFPFLSMMITLWRSMKMVHDIAALYGGRPGWLGSLSLFGLVLQNLLYANVSETVADSVTDLFGGSAMSMVSANLAQGLGSAMLTARVGLKTMEQCRPLPFQAEETTKLNSIRAEIIASLKNLAGGKPAKAASR